MHLKFVQEATCWVFEKLKQTDRKYNGKSVTVFKKKRSLLYTGAGAPLLQCPYVTFTFRNYP
jgi:hypothetical protein